MPASPVLIQMFGFHVILVMDWLGSNYASIDCFKKMVFEPLERGKFRFVGSWVCFLPIVIFVVLVEKLLRDGCQGFLAYVVDAPKENLKLEKIHIFSEYQEVFPETLSTLPSKQEVEFSIDQVQGMSPISKAPC